MKNLLRWLLLAEIWESSWRDARSTLGVLDRTLGEAFNRQPSEKAAANVVEPKTEQLHRWRKNALIALYAWGVAGVIGAIYLLVAVFYGGEANGFGRINAFLFGVFAMVVGFPRSYQAAKTIDAIDTTLQLQKGEGR